MDDVIREKKPSAWLFGHTHESMDVMIGDTRCLSNPYGYQPRALNGKFSPGYTVVVDDETGEVTLDDDPESNWVGT